MSMLRVVGSDILGNCPAQVYMDSGIIEINGDIWDKYTDFQKEFIIQHEVGHFELQTDSETKADNYALKQVYGKAPQSLKKSIQALHKIGVIDNERFRNLYIETLKIDAFKNNNKRALIELKNLGIYKMKVKRSTGKSPFVSSNRNKVDGGDNAESASQLIDNMQDNFFSGLGMQQKKRGFEVGKHYISYEVVALAIIAFLLFGE